MKRILALTLLVVATIVCRAASPNLACEKIFERKDLRAEGRDLVKITQPSNYFRSVTAENDKKLQKDILAAIEQGKKKSCNIVERYNGDGNEDHVILNIENNGCIISIGCYWTEQGYVRLFIQADPEAFK